MQINRMYNNLLELCNVPSISETNGELDMVKKIYQLLKGIDYFIDHPEQVQICQMEKDKHNRSFIYAFMKSQIESTKTVILLSHFDVVGVEEFGILKEYAFNPPLYTKFLKDNPQIQLDEESTIDLKSGDYMFGRGVMDMKFGIAADIEVLFQAEKILGDIEGNILFLSVPDEEANSAGMLAAVEFLLKFKKEKQLEYTCCLVSEPHFPRYPGDHTKYIYTGTVGKLLPVFYCVGKETHVCEPYSGLNPNLLTAKIIEKIDSNSKLSDYKNQTIVPAPICLKQSDTKTTYSVQTPTAAYTYFNFMTLTKTPKEVLQSMMDIAETAFVEVIEDLKKKAQQLYEKTGNMPHLPNFEPKVITFQELYKWCSDVHGEKFKLHLKDFINNYSMNGDMRELSVEVVKEVQKFCPYRDPMIIVFYAPPFYPHSDIQPLNSNAIKVSKYIVEVAKQMFNEGLQIESFFPGLSDMSYLGLSNKVDISELEKNFPIWGSGYNVPLETIAQLNIPFVDIGPLGKDAHKYSERLCLPYSFEKAAVFIWEAVKYLIK